MTNSSNTEYGATDSKFSTPYDDVARTFDVFVMKPQRYELDEIFQKGLLFLLPFHIFSHEKYLKEYDEDQKKLARLEEEYVRIIYKR